MTIHSELKGDVIFTSHKINGDVESTKQRIDGNVEKGLGVVSQWGKITGDIENQTDLIEKFGNYVTEEEFEKVKYIHINRYEYAIDVLRSATIDGISGLVIHFDDGTVDGGVIFLPDSIGMATASNQIIALIPTKISQLTNDSGYITGVSWGQVTGKPNFSAVATSGSYNDLTNKPTIPTVPTNISAFTNDSGYITGINSNMVTTALGFTPYNSTNPNGYTSDSALTSAEIDEVCV